MNSFSNFIGLVKRTPVDNCTRVLNFNLLDCASAKETHNKNRQNNLSDFAIIFMPVNVQRAAAMRSAAADYLLILFFSLIICKFGACQPPETARIEAAGILCTGQLQFYEFFY